MSRRGLERAAPGEMLPAAARLFAPGHGRKRGAPDLARYPAWVIERLLEDGDRADLAWLADRYGEAALGDWLAARGGRRLSRRSRAFWRLILGAETASPTAAADRLWPL